MRRVTLFLLALGLFGQSLTTRDPNSGLVIRYPKGWRVDPDSPVFAIENFAAADRPAQLLVPLGKARIMVAAPPVKSVDELIQRDRLTSANGYISRKTEIQTTEGSIPATEIRMDQNKVIPDGYTLIYALTVRGRVYETYLFCRGASSKPAYEKTYHHIVATLQFPH